MESPALAKRSFSNFWRRGTHVGPTHFTNLGLGWLNGSTHRAIRTIEQAQPSQNINDAGLTS